jgi:hypothetical protein
MEIATMHGMSKGTFLRPDQLKRGVEIELTQRPEWGTAFIRGRVQGKPQLWDVSKSMDKRGRFIDEDELLQHWRTPNMSNTRKEIAARLGFAAGNGAKTAFANNDPALANFLVKYKENENNNYHSENVVLLAEFVGSSSEIAHAKDILRKVEAAGHLPHDLKDEQYSLYKNLAAKLKSKYPDAKFSRSGVKAAFAGDIETKLRSLISRFGFKPDNISASSRFGVAHVEFIDQKGKATEMVSKLKGAMKQMGVPESAITARENQYPADEDGPAQHIGIVTIDFGQMKSSRPGAKTRMTREQTEEQKAGLKIMSAADPAVGAKIAKLIKEGKPQDQAVAIALDMKRRGEL